MREKQDPALLLEFRPGHGWRRPVRARDLGAILAFIFSWNSFIFSVVLGGKTTRILPSAVYNMLTFEQISWGPLAATALLVTLPVLLVTLK
jgi:ABC-type glycerol-3-phosphate transport system permease component